MNPGTFDQLTRRLAMRFSRRTVLGGAFGIFAFGVAATAPQSRVRAKTTCAHVFQHASYLQLAECPDPVQLKEAVPDVCSVPVIERTLRPGDLGYDGNLIQKAMDWYGALLSNWAVDFRDTNGQWLSACQKHDVCYGTCGRDRLDCDNQFLNDMTQACHEMHQGFLGGVALGLCLSKAHGYYRAVRGIEFEPIHVGGQIPFENAQLDHCGCCLDSDLVLPTNPDAGCGPVTSLTETYPGSLILGGDAGRTGIQLGWGPNEHAAVDQRFMDGLAASRTRESSCRLGIGRDGVPLIASLDSVYLTGTIGPEPPNDSYVWGLYRLDAVTGNTVWFAPLTKGAQRGLGYMGPASLVEGTIVIATKENLVRLDADTGQELWRTPVPSIWTVSPLIIDGVIYVVGSGLREDSVLHAVDLATGAELWRLAGEFGYDVSFGDGLILSTNNNGELVAVDATTQAKAWVYAADDLGSPEPCVLDGIAYVTRNDGMVSAIRLVDQVELWRTPVSPGNQIPKVSIDQQCVVVGTRDALVGLDSQTGDRLWSVPGDGTGFSTAAMASGTAIAVTVGGLVLGVDTATGRRRWSVSLDVSGSYGADGPPAWTSPPAVARDRVFIMTSHAHIFAIGSR